jgi:hypothetical protein
LNVLVVLLSGLPAVIGGIVLWLTTSFFSCWAQIVVLRSSLRVPISRSFPWLLIGSIMGWTVSLLLVQLRLMDVAIDSTQLGSAIWIGFLAGGVIGLFPGLFIGLEYWWLIRPDYNATPLLVSNVIGWCLGMGLASAGIFLLLASIVSGMNANF